MELPFKDNTPVLFSYETNGYPRVLWMTLFYSATANAYVMATGVDSNKWDALDINQNITANYGSLWRVKNMYRINAEVQKLSRQDYADVYEELFKKHPIAFRHFFQNVDNDNYGVFMLDFKHICRYNKNYVCIPLTVELK
ncbi:hypothetical protein SS50377_22448 [Spironucleus salmonicida]|uniref:Uncharacterized protein n=1 Tax=Spironucleus salmonicida TaxID=348837 RepID=V6LEE0_9EUKA|nr:hypothetical protein SS50377_22448 [Spironucleus salmonicida]|eukprot:EST42061.1 hypothetical protein SS50377_18368 [Spironucleus salmonicida]